MRRLVAIAGAAALLAALPAAGRGAEAAPTATLSVTSIRSSPAAAAEGTRALLRDRLRELVACYQQELSADREAATQVTLSFTVRGNGSLLAPKAEFPDPRADDAGFAFLECLKQRAAGWTVASPVAGATVEVGLTFSRRAAPAAAPAPPASAASPAAGATAPQEAVGKVAAEHAAEIRACYERELAVDPQLQGKVALRWVIQDDGSAADVRVHEPGTTLRSRKVQDCMVARVGGWRFPAPGPGRTLAVTYPWSLRPQRQPEGAPAGP
jgi:hypothetical protein